MIKMDEEFIRTLFIDTFEYEVNYEDEELNKEFLEVFPGSFSISPAYIMYNDIIDEQSVEVDRIRFEDTIIKDISFEIKELGNGYREITGKAEIAFNIYAISRETYIDSYGSDYADFELTDGSDTGSCTIAFTFKEKKSGSYNYPSGSKFDSHFEVLYE